MTFCTSYQFIAQAILPVASLTCETRRWSKEFWSEIKTPFGNAKKPLYNPKKPSEKPPANDA
jgi:hypothetical protein